MQSIVSRGDFLPLFFEPEPAEASAARTPAHVSTDSPRTFRIGEYRIDVADDGLVNLTAIWRAAGSPDNRSPSEWKRYAGAEFIASLAESIDTGKSRNGSATGSADIRHVWRAQRGGRNGGGAYGHLQVALAFAAYLSPEFHRHVNAAYIEWSQERANPDLKIDRAIEGYQRRGASRSQALERAAGRVQRNRLTDVLKEAGVTQPSYAAVTNSLYRGLLGADAPTIRQGRKLPAKTNLRDHFSAVELSGVRHSEAMAEDGIRSAGVTGDDSCALVARLAGEATAIAHREFAARMQGVMRRA